MFPRSRGRSLVRRRTCSATTVAVTTPPHCFRGRRSAPFAVSRVSRVSEEGTLENLVNEDRHSNDREGLPTD